jgi:hypothetical protein
LKRVFPTLQRLISSSRDLVHLSLGPDVFVGGERLLSPHAFTVALSTTTRLSSLSLNLRIRVTHPEQGDMHPEPPPPNPIVLPALIKFDFEGSKAYLEDLMSRIQ